MSDDQRAPEARQHLIYGVDVFDIDGVPMHIKIAVEYPKGKGFTAAQVLQNIGTPERMKPLWEELIKRQDEQSLSMLFRGQIENNL